MSNPNEIYPLEVFEYTNISGMNYTPIYRLDNGEKFTLVMKLNSVLEPHGLFIDPGESYRICRQADGMEKTKFSEPLPEGSELYGFELAGDGILLDIHHFDNITELPQPLDGKRYVFEGGVGGQLHFETEKLRDPKSDLKELAREINNAIKDWIGYKGTVVIESEPC